MKTAAEINNYLKSLGHSVEQLAVDNALKQLMEGEEVVAAWGFNSLEDTSSNTTYPPYSAAVCPLLYLPI